MFGDLFQWIPGASAMDRPHTQIGAKCFIRHFESQDLWEKSSCYVIHLRLQISTDDVHIKYFYRRQQLLACLQS